MRLYFRHFENQNDGHGDRTVIGHEISHGFDDWLQAQMEI
jgi:predicted metalloendopeptidase